MQVKQNMQVHSTFSRCAKPEMELSSILEQAAKHGLEMIGLTDHLNTPDQWDIPQQVREIMPDIPSGLRVLVGCEAQMVNPGQPSITDEVAATCDVVVIACNHYHLRSVEHPEDTSPDGWAKHHLAMIEGAIDTGFCDIIVHPFLLEKISDIVDIQAVLDAYDDDELARIIKKAAKHRVAFELNPGHVEKAFPFMQKVARLVIQAGGKFSIGSDAHRLNAVGYENYSGGREAVGQFLSRLGLTEEYVWSPRPPVLQ